MIAEVQHFRFRLEFGSVLLCIGSLVGRANTLSVHADSASASFSFRFFMGLRDYSYRINVKVDQGWYLELFLNLYPQPQSLKPSSLNLHLYTIGLRGLMSLPSQPRDSNIP